MSDIIGNGSGPPDDEAGEEAEEDVGPPPWWTWRSLATPGGLAVAGLALGFAALAVLASAQPIGLLTVRLGGIGPHDFGNQYFWPAVVGALVAALGLLSSLLSVRACHGRKPEPGWAPAIARGGVAVSVVGLAIQLTTIGLILATLPAPKGPYANF
jgi:hypothetical protein